MRLKTKTREELKELIEYSKIDNSPLKNISSEIKDAEDIRNGLYYHIYHSLDYINTRDDELDLLDGIMVYAIKFEDILTPAIAYKNRDYIAKLLDKIIGEEIGYYDKKEDNMKADIYKQEVSIDPDLEELVNFFKEVTAKYKLENDPYYIFSRFINEFLPEVEDYGWLILTKPTITMAYNHDLDHNNDGMEGFYVYEMEENKEKQEVIDAIENVEESLIELARKIVKLEDRNENQFEQLQRAFSMSDFPMDIHDLRYTLKNTKLTFKENSSIKEKLQSVSNDPLDLLCDNRGIYKNNYDKVIDTKEVKIYMTKTIFSHNNLDYKVIFQMYLEEEFDYQNGYAEISIIPFNMSRNEQIQLIKDGEYFTFYKENMLKKDDFLNRRRERLRKAYFTITEKPLPVMAINYLKQYN